MRTVMIVDDEKPARELIKMLIDWEKAGYKIISEARDGLEALEEYARFRHDLIITDIQMPQMDGLSLIKEIKQINLDQSIIVLSCHESFTYAREVMKLGIFDYLIKDALTQEDMYTVLKNKLYTKSDDIVVSNSRSIVDEKKSRALWDIINGNLEKDACSQALKACSLTMSNHYFFVHALVDAENSNKYVPEITGRIMEILAPDTGVVCNLKDNHYAILIITNTSHSELDMINQRYNTALSIRTCMEKITGGIITVGVSRFSSDIGLVKERNLEAHQALGYRVFLGKGKILYFDFIQNSARSIKIELIDTRMKNIKTALSQKQADSLSNELKNLYLVDLQGIMQFNYLQHVNALLLGLITSTCSEFNIDYKSLFTGGTIPLDAIHNLETVEEMLLWFTERFNSLIRSLEDTSNEQYTHLVRKIVQYIKQHYFEDIGLDSIANLYNIHKVHLARTFKEDTGFSVNGYIREIRVQEAKKLLKSSDLNVSEIVYKVGFQNFQSFYSIFKKHVGVTPMEFRDM